MNPNQPSYQEMFKDVESIITSIQDSSLELDDMVKEVKRGFELIQKMRSRLDATKNTIQELRMEVEVEVETDSEGMDDHNDDHNDVDSENEENDREDEENLLF